MFVTKLDREKLIHYLSGSLGVFEKPPSATRNAVTAPTDTGVTLIWQEDQADTLGTPSIIVVPDGEIRDFLGWAWTYLIGFRPLTAYFRVLEFSTFRKMESLRSNPFLGSLQGALAGGALGEAAASEDQAIQLENVPVRAYANTFLFLATRAIAYGATDLLDDLFVKWTSTHRLLKQSSSFASRDALLISQIIASLFTKRRRFAGLNIDVQSAVELTDALDELQTEQRISKPTLSRILSHSGDILRSIDQFRDTREQRVIGFESLLANNALSREEPTIAAFMYGYLASLIGPGALSHAALLKPVLQQYPQALSWYGVCAGLYKNSEVLSFAKGLCRRLVRDATSVEPLLANPRADISFDELEMLLSGAKPLEDFRRASNTFVVVELLPTISGSFKWRNTAEQSQLTLFGSQSNKDVMTELEIAARHLVAILQEVGIATPAKNRLPKKKKG
jgi:hypothetical protein